MGYDMHFVRKPEGEKERVEAAHQAYKAASDALKALPKEDGGKVNMDRWSLARAAGSGADIEDPKFWDGRTEQYQELSDAADAAYKAWMDTEESYFRLNISGMSQYSSLMWRFGMEFDAGREPAWPKRETFGVTDEMYESFTSDAIYTVEGKWIYPGDPEWHDLTEDERERTERYVTARDAVLSWHGEGTGIPGHKFGSNDGWIVTPEECRQAVEAWRETCREAGAGDEETGRKALLDALDEFSFSSAYWLKWVAWIERAAEHGGFEVH